MTGGYIQAICLIGAFLLSLIARSELNAVGLKGSYPIENTRMALLLYRVVLTINTLIFPVIFIFLVIGLIFGSPATKEAGATVGLYAVIFCLLMLPFALMWTSQMFQCIQMTKAAIEIEGNNEK